jgi:hypothetical protein
MNRRERRAAAHEEKKDAERLARWGSSPGGKATLNRYSKTFAWAIRQSKKTLNSALELKIMFKYPAAAKDVKDAIVCMDTETALSASGVSNTDVYAIKEAIRHVDKQTAKELVYKTSEKEKTLWDKIRYFFYLLFRKTN